jgi:intracellular septation protein A
VTPDRRSTDEPSQIEKRDVADPARPALAVNATVAEDPAVNDSVDFSRLKSNLPAIATDVGIGLLFFVVARLTDLRTAALVSAGVGIALYPVQWLFRRLSGREVNLLGGMALFGIAMLVLSAAFSWWVESDLAIQLKGTVLGGAVAAAYAVDAACGGRWLGRRLTLYLAYNDLDERRLAVGMSGVGAALAGLNAAIAVGASKEAWLMYSAWGDTVASMVLASVAVQRARRSKSQVQVVSAEVIGQRGR